MCVLSNVCVSSPGDTSNPGAWAEFRAAGADIWVQANAAAASEAAVGSGEQAKGRPRWAQAQIRQGAREPEEQLLCRDGQTCQEAPDILGERCTWQPYHSIPKHYLFCSRLNIIVCIIGLLFTIVKRTSPPHFRPRTLPMMRRSSSSTSRASRRKSSTASWSPRNASTSCARSNSKRFKNSSWLTWNTFFFFFFLSYKQLLIWEGEG